VSGSQAKRNRALLLVSGGGRRLAGARGKTSTNRIVNTPSLKKRREGLGGCGKGVKIAETRSRRGMEYCCRAYFLKGQK